MACKSYLHLLVLILMVSILLHLTDEQDWSNIHGDIGHFNFLQHNDCKPEINAVLLECPRDGKRRETACKDTDNPNVVCETQLMVNVRVNPSFRIKKLDKFLILDEVYDPRRRTKAKIMSPYLIELSRGEPIMMYPLKFAKNVQVECSNTSSDTCGENESNSLNTYVHNHEESENQDKQNDHVEEEKNCQPATTEACETTTKSCTTEKPKSCKPLSMADSEARRITQKFKLKSKGSHNHVKPNKERLMAQDKKQDEKLPVEISNEFGYRNSLVDNKYQNIWSNQDHVLKMQKPMFGDSKGPFLKRIFTNPKHFFDKSTANIAVVKTFAKRLQGNKLAQSDIVMPLGKSTMKEHNSCANIITEEDNIAEGKQGFHKNADNVNKYTNDERNKILLNIDDDTVDKEDEYKDKLFTKNDHVIEKRNVETTIVKRGQNRKFHRHTNRRNMKKRREFMSDSEGNFDKEGAFRNYKGKTNCIPTNFDEDTKETVNKLSSFGATDCSYAINKQSDVEENSYPVDSFYEKKNAHFNQERKHRNFRKSQHINTNYNNADLLKTKVSNAVESQKLNNNMLNRLQRFLSRNNFRHHRKISVKSGTAAREAIFDNLDENIKKNIYKNPREKELISSMRLQNEKLYQPLKVNHFIQSSNIAQSFPKVQNKNKVLTDIDSLYNRKYTSKENSTDEQLTNLFGDNNLNMNDKMVILNTILGETNEKLKFDHLNDKSVPSYHNILKAPYQYPVKEKSNKFIIDGSTNNVVKPFPLSLLNKHKRSFLFYDDMETPENAIGNQEFCDHKLSAISNGVNNDDSSIDDGIQPCATCGGKGRKIKPKTDTDTTSGDNYLNCGCLTSLQNKCTCNKRETSINDAWYSVYNMSAPLPYLTTQVKIFRKRRGTWWRIVPSITLTSLSGIFANANLSVLFSSHVDIFQFEKSLHLRNNQLLVPKGNRYIRDLKKFKSDLHLDENINTNLDYNLDVNPYNLWAVEPSKLNSEKLVIHNHPTHKHEQYKRNSNGFHTYSGSTIWHGFTDPFRVFRNTEEKDDTGVNKILDFGYLPTTMNILQHCPNDKHRLCLNILDNRVPAFNVKIKIPFRENDLIYENIQIVKIANIIADATTKDALQVSVDVINEGPKIRQVSVSISNCNTPCAIAAKTTVKKVLYPYYQETVSFLLPFILENNNMKHKKFHCDVVVKIPKTQSSESEHVDINETDKYMNFGNYENDEKFEHNKGRGYINKNTTHYIRLHKKKKRFSSIEPEQKIIAKRRFDVEIDSRCLCIFKCHCHCVPKLETNVNFHVCEKLNLKEQRNAGFFDDYDSADDENSLDKYTTTITPTTPIESSEPNEPNQPSESSQPSEPAQPAELIEPIEYEGYLWNALLLLLVMLLLGLLKAILGICIKPIDECGYNCVQPGRPYKCASRCRHFCVNTFFFVMLPFLIWCSCFTPTEDDLLVASTDWVCSNAPVTNAYVKSKYSSCKYSESDDDEDIVLSQHLDLNTMKCRQSDRIKGGLDIPPLYCVPDFELNEDVFDVEYDDDDEANTKFVLKALAESRESLRRLHKENDNNTRLQGIVEETITKESKEADEFVAKLKSAQIVYRIFDQPIGDLQNIPAGFKYCIQGYFLPCIGDSFEFVNYNPLAQHRCPSIDGRTMLALRPPVLLCPKQFTRRYHNKYEVLKAADLAVCPPKDAPCINVSTLALIASSVVKLASDHSSLTPPQPQNDASQIIRNNFDINIGSPATNNRGNFNEQTSQTQWTHNSCLCTEIETINDDLLIDERDAARNESNIIRCNLDPILE